MSIISRTVDEQCENKRIKCTLENIFASIIEIYMEND